ncbi:MAG: hypothetical protein M3O28_00690 [Actinomycetota bacterium]|nr:hypothetical protein [Actinomycetota bacterium]
MNIFKSRSSRVLLCGVIATGVLAAATPAFAFGAVSNASAQGVNANIANIVNLAISPTPTTASNDGTQSNAEIDASPILNIPVTEKLVQVGAVKEAAEANQDGSSYGCAGTASPMAIIQVGVPGTGCTVTDTGKGGVTIDLGQLPGLGTALLAAGGDIKITADAVTAHGYQNGTNPAVLGANVSGLSVQLGTNTAVILQSPNQGKNTDLLGEVLGGLFPGATPGSLSPLGTAVDALIAPVIKLTTNYQPAPEPDANGVSSVTGLHLELLGGGLGHVDLAKVTVGPNVPNAVGDAFSFQNLPLILGGIALLLVVGFGLRAGTRRVRGMGGVAS